MPELESAGWMKSLLAARTGTATTEDCEACEEFIRIHNAIIRAVIRRVHKEPADVNDLTQQVWADFFAGLQRLTFDPALRSITAWVVKIANDVANSHIRRQATRRNESLPLDAADSLVDSEPGPGIELELRENEAKLRTLIESFADGLPEERDQRAVRLYWLEEWSLSRITVDMMKSEDSASGILRRVGVKLADYLRRHGYGAVCSKNKKVFQNSRR
jgi:RNA polymerase sigma factor (sigma-70 family)